MKPTILIVLLVVLCACIPDPMPEMILPGHGQVGEVVAFSSLNEAELYQWNFGDPYSDPQDNVSSLPNPNHTFAVPGNYTVTLQLTNNNSMATLQSTIDIK